MCLKYLHPDSELENYALQVFDMLRSDTSIDAQALACVLYIMRVGVTDQMSESTQRSFSVFLAKQLLSSDSTPSMRVAAIRTLSYVLKTLGEVPLEFKEVLDDTVVAALTHDSPLVRVEAALALRALAEVDPSCVGGLISYAMTMLSAARENVSFEKGSNFKRELESLHGQAAVLASLVSISRKLPLGYPTRLPESVLQVCKNLLMEASRNPVAAAVEKEAGWNLLSSLLTSVSKEELHDQVFDILALWASTFSGNPKHHISQSNDLSSEICVWSAAVDALTSYVKCFVSSDPLAGKEQAGVKSSIDLFIIRVLIAYEALSDPSLYKSDHAHIIQICTTPFREASKCEESSCLRLLLDKRDAWLGPWTPGRDWFEDELRSFQGGKDGVLTCVWENEPPSFPQPETTSKMLVNQMLLFFGTMFASQDSSGMLSFIGMIDQCLKTGKRQAWHAASVTNICVGLLAGLKTLLAQRPEPLGMEILSAAQAIFQNILAEGDICPSQRRASSEGLGLLARLGNDIFTARMQTRYLDEYEIGK
ncbi:heat repeat-containing protein 5b, partial [Phtheirospermum japonicum]